MIVGSEDNSFIDKFVMLFRYGERAHFWESRQFTELIIGKEIVTLLSR